MKEGGSVTWDDNLVVYHYVSKDRVTLKYMVKRAYKEGVAKSVLNNTNLERQFLKHYFLHPDRYTILVISATVIGYIWGKLK